MVLVFVKRADGSVHALSVESGDVIDFSKEDGFEELDVSDLSCKLEQLVRETPKERVLAAMAKITGTSPPADESKSDLARALGFACLRTRLGPGASPYVYAVNKPLIQAPYDQVEKVKVSLDSLDDRLRLEFQPSSLENMSVEWSLPAKEDFDASLGNFGCEWTSAVGTRHTGLTWNELIPVMTIDELENFRHVHGWASQDGLFKMFHSAGLHDSHPMLFRHPVLQRLLWFFETLKESLTQWEDHLYHDLKVNYGGDMGILDDAVAQQLRARDL
ncbi:unnamed protein product [Symbiodinium necroappetens]|uniref:Uncharacterized protein n=1 Tax=Symbiodinium necroappetens TaxID=1628268 RepID=A0A813BMU6_9DINO|nr:unnamed protein product [Symbiodinium necroappetens]